MISQTTARLIWLARRAATRTGLLVCLATFAIAALAGPPRAIAQGLPNATEPAGQAAPSVPGATPTQAAPGAAQGAAPQAAPNGGAPAATTSQGQGQPSGGQPAQPAQASPPPAPPLPTNDPLLPQPLLKAAEQQAAEVRRLHKTIDRVKSDDAELSRQREAVETIEAAALETEQKLAPVLDEVENQIKRLGPRPKEGEAPEAESLQKERARLDRIRGLVEGAKKTANLSHLRARQLLGRIHELRLNNFTRNLFERRTSPLAPELWQDVVRSWPRLARQFTTIAENWWGVARERPGLLALTLFGAALIYGVLALLREIIIRRALNRAQPTQATLFFQRAGFAFALMPVIAAPLLAAATFVYGGFELFELSNSQTRPILQGLWVAFAIYTGVTALARAVLMPRYPQWRMVALPNKSASRFLLLSNLIAAVYAADLFLDGVSRHFYLPVVFGIVVTFVANVAFAGLLVAIAWVPVPEQSDTTRTSGRLVQRILDLLKLPAVIVALVIVGTTLFGYIALGRFIAGQVLLTGCGALVVLLCHLAIRALTALSADDVDLEKNGYFGGRLSLAALRQRQIAGLISFILNAVLITVAVGLLLLSWGFSQAALLDWIKSAFFGFEIGQFRISLFRIMIAVGLFVAVVFLTRLLQRWLSGSVLTPKRVDTGIANSIHQGIGYAGMALAALVAVSYVGLDVTNLAIVAGALSVGIGFGLQSIVNNFVSGLILLVERPVKVGDWIVVGTNEGYVRKISVRATEIETFDRASVIVPNSELITGTVQNWTHRNAMGRIVLRIGASYNADPEHVLQVLMRIAHESDMLLKFPEPFAVFEDFGASSLDFSLRCYIGDVKRSLATQTALRTAIYKAFKAEGIEIPFPQQDIHLRDLDGVRGMLQRAAERRMAEAVNTSTAPQSGAEAAGAEPERAQSTAPSRKPHAVDVPLSETDTPGSADGGSER